MAIDRIRGSVNLPLTVQGHIQVADLASRIASKGGLDHIHTSDLQRTMHTAMPIALASGAHLSVNPKLRDMAYGILEGQKSKDAIPEINKHITEMPDKPLPGHAPDSTSEGESFNQYKRRILPSIQAVIQETRDNPKSKVGVVVNRRTLKTVTGWLKAGAKSDLSVDTTEATSHKDGDASPGTVHHIDVSSKTPSINAVDTTTDEKLKPGVYLIRHGLTAWNGESK